jgi:RNA polymerase sigma-70 factor (ECF subfamily)
MSDTDLAASDVSPLWRTPGPAPAVAADRDEASVRARFEAILEPLMPDLLRYFARRVIPREDAADCLSETLLVLWKHRDRLPATGGEQRAWAYGIAHKVLSNHQRKRLRRGAASYALRASLAAEPAAVPQAAERALEALDALPALERELIRLVVWDGFGVGEAGVILGLKAATARSRYARAKARLRQTLNGN